MADRSHCDSKPPVDVDEMKIAGRGQGEQTDK